MQETRPSRQRHHTGLCKTVVQYFCNSMSFKQQIAVFLRVLLEFEQLEGQAARHWQVSVSWPKQRHITIEVERYITKPAPAIHISLIQTISVQPYQYMLTRALMMAGVGGCSGSELVVAKY